MEKVIVLLLLLIIADSTVSRNLLSRRNADNTKQINSAGNDPTPNKLNTEIGINMDSRTPRNINKQDTTEPMQSGMRSQYEIQKNIPSDSDTKKQALRNNQKNYFEDIITSSTFRTTSEDTLRWLLKQQLPFPHPGPDHIGQLNRDIMLPVTEPLWRFEDYDDAESINQQIKDDSTTCEAQKVRCIADTDYNQPVCVTDLTMDDVKIRAEFKQKGFSSLCEVTYRNCLKRYELSGKNYADHYREDYLEFLHYGWCERCGILISC